MCACVCVYVCMCVCACVCMCVCVGVCMLMCVYYVRSYWYYSLSPIPLLQYGMEGEQWVSKWNMLYPLFALCLMQHMHTCGPAMCLWVTSSGHVLVSELSRCQLSLLCKPWCPTLALFPGLPSVSVLAAWIIEHREMDWKHTLSGRMQVSPEVHVFM